MDDMQLDERGLAFASLNASKAAVTHGRLQTGTASKTSPFRHSGRNTTDKDYLERCKEQKHPAKDKAAKRQFRSHTERAPSYRNTNQGIDNQPGNRQDNSSCQEGRP